MDYLGNIRHWKDGDKNIVPLSEHYSLARKPNDELIIALS